MLKLTLHELETFVAISQAGTIRAAGKLLGLSQSATSGALAELERRLGIQLFDRVGRGIVLNESGRALLPRATDILQQANELEADFKQGGQSRLRIGASQTIGNVLMPALLQQLLNDSPACQVELEIVNSETVMERLLDCRADFGLIEAPYTHPLLVFEPWLEDELVVYAAADHPLATHPITPEALSRGPWIMREAGSGVRRVLENSLLPHLGNLRVRLELGSSEAINEAVRCGLGISCASRRALARELERREIVLLPTPGIDLTRRFYLTWHLQRKLSTDSEKLRKICHRMLDRERAASDRDQPDAQDAHRPCPCVSLAMQSSFSAR
jgi:DNA-binding transcriptional LysR family regulator